MGTRARSDVVTKLAVGDVMLPRHRYWAWFLFAVLLCGTLVAIVVPAGPGWDFANFYDAGARVAAGLSEDLYELGRPIDGREPQGLMEFWGTPISAWVYAPMSVLSPSVALMVFKAENALAYFAALVLLYRHNLHFVGRSRLERSRFALTFLALAVIYQPFWTVYRVGGQTTATVLLLFTLGFLSYVRGRFLWAALWLIVGIAIKPAFVSVLVILMAVSGTRFFWSSMAVGLLAVGGAMVLMGWSVHQEFLTFVMSAADRHSPWIYNSSIYVPIQTIRSFLPDVASGVVAGAASALRLVVVATTAFLLITSRRQNWSIAVRRHFYFLIALCASLLLSPIVWEHYLAFLFLPLIYLIASARHFSRSARVAIIVMVLLASWQNLIIINLLHSVTDWNTPTKSVTISLLKSGSLLLLLFFLWTYRSGLFKSHENFERDMSGAEVGGVKNGLVPLGEQGISG